MANGKVEFQGFRKLVLDAMRLTAHIHKQDLELTARCLAVYPSHSWSILRDDSVIHIHCDTMIVVLYTQLHN